MTVLASEPNKVVANGNGVATVFSFSPMVIYENDDLQVTFVSTTGVETPLLEGTGTTNYIVNVTSLPGTGSITFPADPLGAKLQTGEKIIMKPVFLFEQAVDLQNQGGYFPDVQETMHDKAIKLMKQLVEISDRSIKLPATEDGGATTILPPAATRANKFLGFGADGTQLVVASVTPSSTLVSAFGATLVDDLDSHEARKTLDAAKRNWITDNLVLRVTTNAGALDIAVLAQDSQNPSSTNPLVFQFANTTDGIFGTIAQITVTSALTLQVSAGSSLGTVNGVPARIYIGVANDNGTARLFAYNPTNPVTGDYLGLQEDVKYTSTAEGGAGAADSAQVLYSGTAFTSRHIRLLGYLDCTQSIAGTWSTDPTRTVLMSNLAIEQLQPTTAVQAESVAENPIINGNMEIWQRDSSFTGPLTGAYTADQFSWLNSGGGAGVVNIVRNTVPVPTVAEAGVLFNYNLGVVVTTADASIGVTDLYGVVHKIEGYNWRHFSQREIALSFWVRSAKVGIHCIGLGNFGSDRFFIGEYTINTANTWERKTIVIPPSPSAGTWNTFGGLGLQIVWVMACGSGNQGTAGSWQTGSSKATSNQVNVMDTINNVFAITGIRLDIGNAAKKIGFRSFTEELNLCKRYFQKGFEHTVVPAQNYGNSLSVMTIAFRTTGAGTVASRVTIPLSPPMRVSPSVTFFNPAAANALARNITDANDNVISSNSREHRLEVVVEGSATTTIGDQLEFGWMATAEL